MGTGNLAVALINIFCFVCDLFTDKEVSSIDPGNGCLRVTADYASSRRSSEPYAFFGYPGRMYETIDHGRTGSVGMQKSADAVAAHH